MLAVLFLVVSWCIPASAPAMTKCLCDDGSIAWSATDGDDCDDVCDDQGGGGKVWQPGDPDGGAQDNDDDVTIREPIRERPIERRGR